MWASSAWPTTPMAALTMSTKVEVATATSGGKPSKENHSRNVHDAAARCPGMELMKPTKKEQPMPSQILLLGSSFGSNSSAERLAALLRELQYMKQPRKASDAAEGDREGGAREPFAHVAPEEGARHRGECKGLATAKDDALLPEVGPGARERIEEHAEEARAHDLLNVREGAARRLAS